MENCDRIFTSSPVPSIKLRKAKGVDEDTAEAAYTMTWEREGKNAPLKKFPGLYILVMSKGEGESATAES